MESTDAEDLIIADCKEGEVALEIDIRTPIVNDEPFGDAMFDEKKFRRWNGGEEIKESIFISGFQKAEFGAEIAIDGGGLGEFVEEEFKGHKWCWCLGLADIDPVGRHTQSESQRTIREKLRCNG